MGSYFARVCWNSEGWKRPTGEASRLESGSHVKVAGFGHEEWLFDETRAVDGWRYGFLQPVNKALDRLRRDGDLDIDVSLYAVDPNRHRVLVGELHHAHVLTETQSADAVRIYRSNRWLKEMDQQLAALKVPLAKRLSGQRPREIFNIRFRAEDARLWDPTRQVPADWVIARAKRYDLFRASDAVRERAFRLNRRAAEQLNDTALRPRRAVAATVVDPVERRMQGEIREVLAAQCGESAIEAERDFVDLTVCLGETAHLIEIKHATTAREAIRRSLGQLLDYALLRQPRLENVILWIVGSAPLRDGMVEFMRFLQEHARLPIHYRQYTPGSRRFALKPE